MLNTLKTLNPHLQIFNICDEAFIPYGKVLRGYDFSGLFQIMDKKEIPSEGNVYVAKDEDLMADPVVEELSGVFYGSMPVQTGYCNGNSCRLNALEYHKGSEIDIAVTDLVLLLGCISDIQNNTLDVSSVRAFYVPAGTACELYGTTLHFAPCKVSDDGFKSIIVLPDKTNTPLTSLPKTRDPESQLLWMQNKWLIAHPESAQASKGAHAGITGSNLEVFYK